MVHAAKTAAAERRKRMSSMIEPTADDLRYIRKFPDKCCAEVSRGGESQPCDKTAVAVTIDAEDEHWWPVCSYHTRGRRMVTLSNLLANH